MKTGKFNPGWTACECGQRYQFFTSAERNGGCPRCREIESRREFTVERVAHTPGIIQDWFNVRLPHCRT
jgi:Zn finger protein HypA/HybF involved in hydrogenase expression